MPAAEWSASSRATTAIDADWKPNLLSVELLLQPHHASRLEISPE